jgi:flagellar hook-associated protein 1
MTTLNHILNTGSESLHNARIGVDVTGHNISNAQTPGFSRQRMLLETRHPLEYNLHIVGNGARIETIERMHNRFIEGQLRSEMQTNNRLESLGDGLTRLENLFNPDLTSTIRERVNSFVNALRDFANFPEEPAVRINVAEHGLALTQAFNATHSGIVQTQMDANSEIEGHIISLNQKVAEVAELNGRIREIGAGMRSPVNDLEDRRDQLIKEIGSLININAYKDSNDQYTIRGPGEYLLVEGRLSAKVKLDENPNITFNRKVMISNFEHKNFRDITNKTISGKVGGLIDLRDNYAQPLRDEVNQLALGFAQQFNAIHRKGFGAYQYKEKDGRDFFTGIEGIGEPAQEIIVEPLVINDNAGR